MVKLFEIPIYGLSSKTIDDRYQKYCENFQKQHPDVVGEHFERCIEHLTYPQRCWNYNHIVGYILIYFERNDIFYDVYLPYQCDRYRWDSHKKTFIRNVFANGTHFRIDDPTNNEKIQNELAEMLDMTIRAHVPNRFYVDREAFDNTYRFINYGEIILRSTSE